MWLNNPRRPQEACGTSGMKAALNGGLNLSILDGWWDECFDGENGWAISSAEHEEDLERRDEVEAGSLFELLERQVVPLFYERWQGPVPRRWVQRMKRSLVTLGPFVTAARMVRDYTEQLYEPTARGRRRPRRRRLRPAPATLAALEGSGCVAGWPGVHVDHLDLDRVGRRARHRAHGRGGRVARRPRRPATSRCSSSTAPSARAASSPRSPIVPMEPAGAADDGHLRYTGRFTCEQAGRYGVTVRVVPPHADLVTPVELGLIAWASDLRRSAAWAARAEVGLAGAVLEEGLHADGGVVGAEAVGEQLLLEVEAAGERAVEARGRWPAWRAPGPRPRRRRSWAARASARSWSSSGGTTSSTRPIASASVGADLAAGEDEVLGPGRADEAGQALRAAAAGDDAEQDLRLAELGLLAGDPEVAGQGQLAAAAEGEAADARRSWRGGCGHRVEGPVGSGRRARGPRRGVITCVGSPAELGDLGAGREEPIAAGDHHRAGRVVLQVEGGRLELAAAAPSTAR